MAYAVNHHEGYNSDTQDKYDAEEDDETTSFLAQILSEASTEQSEQAPEPLPRYLSPDYTTTRASAMMMTDDFILMDEHHEEEDKREVDEPNTNSDSLNDHTRVCALEASLFTHPTQAGTAALGARTVPAGSYPHDRSGVSPTSRKGPDLGGSKGVGVSDSVDKTVTRPRDSFSVRLLFPDKKYPTMIYTVYTDMPVFTLRLQISELLEQPFLVHLLVGVSWTANRLKHAGTITDRVFPGTTVPCPFLQQGSRVLVYLTKPEGESHEAPETVSIGQSSLDIAPAVGGWLSEHTKAAMKRVALQKRPERPTLPKSDFYDSYVRGKHVGSRNTADSPINPIRQASPTYSEVYTATLTTFVKNPVKHNSILL
jgi:hypothetical protein